MPTTCLHAPSTQVGVVPGPGLGGSDTATLPCVSRGPVGPVCDTAKTLWAAPPVDLIPKLLLMLPALKKPMCCHPGVAQRPMVASVVRQTQNSPEFTSVGNYCPPGLVAPEEENSYVLQPSTVWSGFKLHQLDADAKPWDLCRVNPILLAFLVPHWAFGSPDSQNRCLTDSVLNKSFSAVKKRIPNNRDRMPGTHPSMFVEPLFVSHVLTSLQLELFHLKLDLPDRLHHIRERVGSVGSIPTSEHSNT